MWFFAQKLSHHGVAGKSCSGRRQVLDLNVMFVTLRAEESLRYARYCRQAIAQATGLRYQKLRYQNGTMEPMKEGSADHKADGGFSWIAGACSWGCFFW